MKTLRVSFAGLVLFCLSQTLICPVSADVRIQENLLPTPEGKVQMLTVDDGSVIYGRIGKTSHLFGTWYQGCFEQSEWRVLGTQPERKSASVRTDGKIA